MGMVLGFGGGKATKTSRGGPEESQSAVGRMNNEERLSWPAQVVLRKLTVTQSRGGETKKIGGSARLEGHRVVSGWASKFKLKLRAMTIERRGGVSFTA